VPAAGAEPVVDAEPVVVVADASPAGVAVGTAAVSVEVVVVVVASVDDVSCFVHAPSATTAERTRSAFVSFKVFPLVKY
jgi:hypothetical protein